MHCETRGRAPFEIPDDAEAANNSTAALALSQRLEDQSCANQQGLWQQRLTHQHIADMKTGALIPSKRKLTIAIPHDPEGHK